MKRTFTSHVEVVWRQKDWEEKEEVLGSICVVITVCAAWIPGLVLGPAPPLICRYQISPSAAAWTWIPPVTS